MVDVKEKYVINPARRAPRKAYQPYVPNYQLQGIEPEKVNFPPKGPFSPIANLRPSPMTQVNVPAVGNVDMSWANLDDMVIDEESLGLDPNHPMIDNNEIMNVPQQTWQAPITQTMQTMETVEPTINQDYLLLVHNQIVDSGSMEYVQQQVQALLYEEHPLSQNNSITEADIQVFKKVEIKIGIFLVG